MNNDQILQTILSIIKDDLGISTDIDPCKSLLQTNTFDSMDWISYLTIVEEKFGINIPTEEASKHQIGIINNMVTYLKGRTGD